MSEGWQFAFAAMQILVSLFMVMMMFFMRTLSANLSRVDNDVRELRVLVAGDYVKRSDLKDEFRELNQRLDEMSKKFDDYVTAQLNAPHNRRANDG